MIRYYLLVQLDKNREQGDWITHPATLEIGYDSPRLITPG
jgi:hypothetical protein